MPEDDYGQDDGERVGDDSPFATSMRAQPWVRMGGLTPWHMWGNSQTLPPLKPAGETALENLPFEVGQLTKVAYKRPESWHWLLGARFVSAPISSEIVPFPSSTILIVRLDFEVIAGHGRSQFAMPTFEHFEWRWVNTRPINVPMWSASALSPNLVHVADGVEDPGSVRRPFDTLVAEDIQCRCRATWEVGAFQPPPQGFPPMLLEVSAFFAPKTHVRPDWLQVDVPESAQFPGEELRGK